VEGFGSGGGIARRSIYSIAERFHWLCGGDWESRRPPSGSKAKEEEDGTETARPAAPPHAKPPPLGLGRESGRETG